MLPIMNTFKNRTCSGCHPGEGTIATMDPKAPPTVTGTRQARLKAETRQIILEAAKALFAEKGYVMTTIRGVAHRAGVGVGTVMSHFPDKTALLTAALLGDWNATLSQALTAMPPGISWRDQLLHIAGAFYAYYADRPSLSQALLKEQLFNSKAWSDELAGKESEMLELTGHQLALAQAAGQIRPGVDCRLAAEALFALYQLVLYQGLTQAQPRPGEMLARLASLADLLMAGLAADGQ